MEGEFVLQLHTHHQIRAIESVPAKERILYIGTHDNLIKFPIEAQSETPKVFNYFFLMNDLLKMSKNKDTYKILISEVATSALHTAYTMVSMLENIGKDYVKVRTYSLKITSTICLIINLDL